MRVSVVFAILASCYVQLSFGDEGKAIDQKKCRKNAEKAVLAQLEAKKYLFPIVDEETDVQGRDNVIAATLSDFKEPQLGFDTFDVFMDTTVSKCPVQSIVRTGGTH